MKTFLVLVLAVLGFFRASAQVSVELLLDQEQFLPSESIPVGVKITNRSGQPVHLGAEPTWLTFSVESSDGFVVVKKSEVPVLGEFDLESSQLGIKRVDLQPYFSMTKSGRYKLVATVRIKDWSITVSSAPTFFDVINGAAIWTQDFGVPVAGGPPEMRKFTLQQANYLRSQLRLYVMVTDASETHVFRAAALGPMVSFGRPEAQVDRTSQLHVLWQAGGQNFSYFIINPDGLVASRETYDYFNTRPRLSVTQDGNVTVVGGVRRLKPAEAPAVPAPVAPVAPASGMQTPESATQISAQPAADLPAPQPSVPATNP